MTDILNLLSECANRRLVPRDLEQIVVEI